MNKLELYMGGRNKNYNAILVYDNGKITMKKGSTIFPTISSSEKFKYSKEALNYRNDKQVVLNNILLKDIDFSSLSAAAQFVCGYSVSGNYAWTTKEGIKFKDLK